MSGLRPDGTRDVLCIVNYPTEGALNWELELNALKERGVEQINLIISDAAHQFCVVRFKRHVLNQVTKKDKDLLKQELDKLFPIQEKGLTPLKAFEDLCTFA